jgi:hypothetical protein
MYIYVCIYMYIYIYIIFQDREVSQVERRLFSELNESECSSQDRDTTETNHKPLLCSQSSCPSIDHCFNVHGNSQTWPNPNQLNVELVIPKQDSQLLWGVYSKGSANSHACACHPLVFSLCYYCYDEV